jgi:septal ring factor EnvC (AmiA/AmiB activator)
MSTNRPLSDDELKAILERAARLGDRGWRQQPEAALGVFTLRAADADDAVHLYAPPDKGRAIVETLESARQDLPRLAEEVRRLREEVDNARAKAREAARARPAEKDERAAAPPRAAEAFAMDDDAALSLAAPFRVGPKEMKAAQTDPLAALSVQVAKALQPDAKEIERARLIAMAFAASKGDLDAFWAARKMRTPPAGGKTGRKK